MIKFLKFFVSWFLTYGINLGLTMFLIEKIGLSKDISYFISISIITIINFIISLKFVFKKLFNINIFIKYTLFLVLFSFFNYLTVSILSKYFSDKLYYLIIFLVTTFIFFIKFIIYDKYVFWNKKDEEYTF